MDPDRLFVLGDTHGRTGRALDMLDAARAAGCRVVVQVGDFGWYPHLDAGVAYIAELDRAAAAVGVEVWFCGGNHDNWDALDELERTGERDPRGLVIAGAALRYLPRPCVVEISGRRIGVLGGAWSIDAADSVPGVHWWPQEQPSGAHAVALADTGRLDVLVSHDAPGQLDLSRAAMFGRDTDGGGRGTRAALDMLVAVCRPAVAIHGHWHWRHSTRLANGTMAEGLGSHDAARTEHGAVLDLVTLTVTPAAAPVPTREPWWSP